MALCLWIHSLCFYFSGLYWVTTVSLEGLLLLVLILSLYGLLLGWVVQLLYGRLAIPPSGGLILAWIAVDFLRGHLFTGFPWLFLGHSQYRFLHLIQIADITGVYGITLLILLVNESFSSLLRWRFKGRLQKRRMLACFGTGVLFLLSLLYGSSRMRKDFQSGPLITAIQGNVPLEVKMNRMNSQEILKKHLALTLQAVEGGEGFDLLVWSETMFPYPIVEGPGSEVYEWRLEWLGNFVRHTLKRPFIVGAQYFLTDGMKVKKEFNSAFYFSKNGEVLGRYDKVRLVPVGEYIPLKEYNPFADFVQEEITKRAGFLPNLSPGEGGRIFSLQAGGKETRFGILVCYENVFPHLVRDAALRGAEYIVNISNDGWFGRSAELDQVLAITAFRAVENRITLFRATNTGISALIDPNGAIRHTLRVNGEEKEVEGIFSSRVLLDGRRTLYTRVGDVFAKGFLAMNTLLVLLCLLSRKKQSRFFQEKNLLL